MLTCHFCTTPVALSFCTAQSKHLTMNDTFTNLYVCNLAAQKQSKSQTDSSILPICINTHGQYTTPTCPKCAYKISQIFSRVFEFALAKFARNPWKFMYREYFRFYNNCSTMFRWEPEGHYRCTKSMVIVPFWFSAEDMQGQKKKELCCPLLNWNLKLVKYLIFFHVCSFGTDFKWSNLNLRMKLFPIIIIIKYLYRAFPHEAQSAYNQFKNNYTCKKNITITNY